MKQKKDERINVHDDEQVRKAGLFRPFDVIPRDPSVWTKTDKERKALRKMKHIKLYNGHFIVDPIKHPVVTAKLIVQLKKNNKFNKTTYSFICTDTSVANILRKFITTSKSGKSINWIAKYSYNGISYAPNETIICR